MEIYMKRRLNNMMNGFGLMLDTNDRKEALREVRKWVDKELGEPTTSIKVEGNKTTVTLPDGRVGVSRCNPCDKFDIITGIRVALDDIERKSRKLSLIERQMIQTAFDLGAQNIKLYRYDSDTNVIMFLGDKNQELMAIQHDDAFDWLDHGKEYVIKELIKNRL